MTIKPCHKAGFFLEHAKPDCLQSFSTSHLPRYRQGYRPHVHRKKPLGKPVAKHIRHGKATRSSTRACGEHVFGYGKEPMAITIHSIGQARAAGRITMANLSDKFRRLVSMSDDRP